MLMLLVRHALTSATGKKLTGWLPGFSLSDAGVQQASALSTRLAGLPVKAIYSSPLERCMETAQTISIPHHLEVVTDPALGEVRYGQWQGRSLMSLYKTKAWIELRARPGDFRFPGGETVREAQVRAMEALESLRRKHRNQTVVVCTHADIIRVVTAGFLGLSLDLYSRISIAPASVTAFYAGKNSTQLLKLGDTGTLEDLKERLLSKKRSNPSSAAKRTGR